MKQKNGIYWLASYPKSGNTWFRAYLANLQNGTNEVVDINALETGEIASSRGWLDELLGFDSADLLSAEIENLRPEIYRWTVNHEEKGIGYHKTHDAYIRLASGEPMMSTEATLGALYIIRNPLDVAISASHHWGCSIDKAIANMGKSDFELAKSTRGLNSQVGQKMFDWSSHVLSWVDASNLNRCVIRYEDMLSAPFSTFSKASHFLNLAADDAAIQRAIEFSSFDVLATQEKEKGFKERSFKAERFFRSGKSGDWRQTLTTCQIDTIITNHHDVMRRFSYLDNQGSPYISN